MKPVDPKDLWLRSNVLVHDPGNRSQLLADLERILDYLPQMVWASVPGDPPLEHYNRYWRAFTGAEPSSDGLTRRALIHPDDKDQALAAWDKARRRGQPYRAQYRIRHHSGEYRWILSRGEPQRNRDGDVVCWYGTCSDVNDEVSAKEALDASVALNQSIVQSSPDGIKLLDEEGRIVFLNDAASHDHGLLGRQIRAGDNWLDTLPHEARSGAELALRAALDGRISRFTSASLAENAKMRWRDFVLSPVARADARIQQVVVNSRDVTDQRLVQEQLRWTSNHDGLTGLPNRSFFDECVQEAIRQTSGSSGQVGLLIVDIDHLKQLNDALGHDAGDRLLAVFSERLRECVGTHDVVGRLGGDEFGVLLLGVNSGADVLDVADRILKRLREPFDYEGRLLDCRASIGGSIFPDQGRHKSELMKYADLALYSAKKAGRLQAVMFEPSMRAEMQTRASMLSLTQPALRERRVFPYYQPKVDLLTGKVIGFEALMRWRDAKGRVHLPGTIAAAFDDKELAPAITDAIVTAAIADMKEWRAAEIEFGHVAINASAPDFRAPDFAARLIARVEEAELPASCLQLEVTETVFVGRGAECVERALSQLSGAGIKIALDDFGTGYASLSHLKKFPVDVLKIDQSFVRDLDTDPEDAAIIRGIINLARSLGIELVAEGIERESQAAFLVECGCQVGQGYLYERPVGPDRVPSVARSLLLRGNKPPLGSLARKAAS